MCGEQVRMDGSNGGLDMRMSVPESLGAFHRTTGKPDGSLLLLGDSCIQALVPLSRRSGQ